ncbi:MAG: hypothetical protein LR011_11510 [Verrucomicrobia bacterium]|nr:hypothetical protein [Verrucomicrobiota bacterium]
MVTTSAQSQVKPHPMALVSGGIRKWKFRVVGLVVILSGMLPGIHDNSPWRLPSNTESGIRIEDEPSARAQNRIMDSSEASLAESIDAQPEASLENPLDQNIPTSSQSVRMNTLEMEKNFFQTLQDLRKEVAGLEMVIQSTREEFEIARFQSIPSHSGYPPEKDRIDWLREMETKSEKLKDLQSHYQESRGKLAKLADIYRTIQIEKSREAAEGKSPGDFDGGE